LRGHPRTVKLQASSLKIVLEKNLLFLLSKYYFDRKCSFVDAQFVMLPPPTSNQLVNIFSPPPNDPSSGRTGGASSGRASALTAGSNATSNISFDTQGPPYTTIRPIPRQGSFVVLDAEGLASKKPSGREKGASNMLLSIISQVPDAFNCSDSSPQWEEVFKRMIAEFYQSGPSRLSGALHGHFVDL
jgi:hypothetical protein